MSAHLVNWDDLGKHRVEQGDLRAAWTNLGAATGTWGVGLRRIEVDPGRRSTPAHVHGAEEEIVYVLGGSGFSWQDGEVFSLAPGDCVVHLPGKSAHTLIAGDEGLDALVFGTRVPVETGWLPRAHVSWLGKTWVSAGEGAHPWARELAAGELARPEPSTPRPPNIVAYRDVAEETRHRGDCIRIERDLLTVGTKGAFVRVDRESGRFTQVRLFTFAAYVTDAWDEGINHPEFDGVIGRVVASALLARGIQRAEEKA